MHMYVSFMSHRYLPKSIRKDYQYDNAVAYTHINRPENK